VLYQITDREAMNSGDGIRTASMGLPAMGKPLGNIIMKHFVNAKSEAKRWNNLIGQSAGFVLFTTEKNDAVHWIRLGQYFQRFGLTATKLNISHSHVNMPCEETAVRQKLAVRLNLRDRFPLLLIRFGYSEPKPDSFRRNIEKVIVSSQKN
jgi:hypothetical protein